MDQFCTECHRLAKYGVFSGARCSKHRRWYDFINYERDIIVTYESTEPVNVEAAAVEQIHVVDLDAPVWSVSAPDCAPLPLLSRTIVSLD